MRQKQSFLLSILPAEGQQLAIRGRIQCISDGATFSFASFEELQALLQQQLAARSGENLNTGVHEYQFTYTAQQVDYPRSLEEDT